MRPNARDLNADVCPTPAQFDGQGRLLGNDTVMRLPNGIKAELGTKIEDYVLNPLHRDGRNKARVFEAILGITLADAPLLRRALLDAAATSDDAEAKGDNGFGEVYVLRFPMTTAKGSATILSAWVIRHGEDFPRLTTCYIV